MALTEYDKEHLEEILAGEGDWFTARVLRALHSLLPRADRINRYKLEAMWPEETKALEEFYGK